MSTEDADRVRGVLRQVAAGVHVVPQAAREALAAFERLSPSPAPVLTGHAWCVCDHEHDTYMATGKPVEDCDWVFCRCPGFRPRSLAPPSEAERERLREQLRTILLKRDAERRKSPRGR